MRRGLQRCWRLLGSDGVRVSTLKLVFNLTYVSYTFLYACCENFQSVQRKLKRPEMKEPKRSERVAMDRTERKAVKSWRWHRWLQFLFFCLDTGSTSRYRSPTSIPRIEKLATIRGARTPIVGAAVPNTNNSDRKWPRARKKVHSVMW